MDELESLRQKRMEELQAIAAQQDEQANISQQIRQLEAIARTLFTREALERFGNIKAAHPEKAVRILASIGQMVQRGIARKISDDDLKRMLVTLQEKNTQIRIVRK